MRRAPAVSTDSNPRRIPARVRDEVILRDGQRCTYVSPDGKRCDSTRLLQIDHIVPVARGGTARLDNLRVLCAYHNRLEAEKLGLPGVPVRGTRTASARGGADRRALSH
jgi:5-methylcytosine-specific restriction endonuclease McrA